jgi:hypothetical protein
MYCFVKKTVGAGGENSFMMSEKDVKKADFDLMPE